MLDIGAVRWDTQHHGVLQRRPWLRGHYSAALSQVVNKAALTVTADNKTRVYGAANPAFTATITGFKNGENLATSGVTGTPI